MTPAENGAVEGSLRIGSHVSFLAAVDDSPIAAPVDLESLLTVIDPTGPRVPDLRSEVELATLEPKVEMKQRRFEVQAPFALGVNSNGIDPLSEAVNFNVSGYARSIPAGSFKLAGPSENGDGRRFVYDIKMAGGVTLHVQIAAIDRTHYVFKAEGTAAGLDGLREDGRGIFSLRIGDDSGRVVLSAATR
jgi:hypothetical protein